jgi:hypothetical protein
VNCRALAKAGSSGYINLARSKRGMDFQPFPSGRNSAVECQLPKLDVVGSSPIARSKVSF